METLIPCGNLLASKYFLSRKGVGDNSYSQRCAFCEDKARTISTASSGTAIAGNNGVRDNLSAVYRHP